MDRISQFVSRKSSWPSFVAGKYDTHLPVTTKPESKIRVKTLLGHCLYRRVFIWTFIIVICLTITLFNPHLNVRSREVLDLVNLRKGQSKTKPEQEGHTGLHTQDGKDEDKAIQDNPGTEVVMIGESEKGPVREYADENELLDEDGPHWLRYKHLDGYYNGLRSLVPVSEYKPEYPQSSHAPESETSISPVHHTELPRPNVFRPHPDYDSEEYRKKYFQVQPCYLNEEKSILPPDLYAYEGIPQGQAEPAMGSYDLLGIRQDVCFDRFGRYGPYGLGYSLEQGGVGAGVETEKEGSDAVWEKTGKIDYVGINWASAQEQCFLKNQDRFFTGNVTLDAELADEYPEKIDRTAVVIRMFTGFKWTTHTLLNFRAMISELSLKSGGEYDVHFLLHVHDNDAPIWADEATVQRILDENVPRELHGLCTLWSEAQMRLYYPGSFGAAFENPSNGDIHGVYRSAHMPLQHFAMMHPEYAHFWNWEMDMRWTGSYYELFDRLGKWAAKQGRLGMWERSAKYYIPAFHGNWDNFTQLVEEETLATRKRSVLGPVSFPGKTSLRYGEDFLPESCAAGSDMSQCGVGEDADIITLNPIFDTEESGWVFASDATGYDTKLEKPPRRSSIVTASRLSRRLLSVMHEETWRMHHSMFSEMFPSTMAFHHGLKAVFAPHPVYLDRAWPIRNIDKTFNGGRDHSTGGHGSPFDLDNEHNFKGTSWYYNSEFAGLLWRRWLGYPQLDGRSDNNGGRSNEGTLRGGRHEEEDPSGSGRLCLRSMLVHPIKWENPADH